MQPYKKAYLKHHGLTEADWIGCKICDETAVDLHHIEHRTKANLNDPKNLIPLCRIHHINISQYDKQHLIKLNQ